MTVLPDWKQGSNFRRYLLLPRPLDVVTANRLAAAVGRMPGVQPYVQWRPGCGGVILVPRRDDLEKFFLLPEEQVVFARTARDDAHDAALVQVLRAVTAELSLMEHERGLEPYSLGKALCDDCGAHEKHRSRRMIVNHWPVADGSPCAPWKGAQYNVTYG